LQGLAEQVHAVIDARELIQRQHDAPDEAAAAHRQRVEHAHLDVGVRRQAGDELVLAGGSEATGEDDEEGRDGGDGERERDQGGGVVVAEGLHGELLGALRLSRGIRFRPAASLEKIAPHAE
jgi:hypothetical protein